MDLQAALVTFPLVVAGELPDKTMFANVVLATRGRPLQVWIGSSLAFLVHVAIAVTIGVALYRLLPHQVVEAIVAAVFAAGAVYAWRSSREGEEDEPVRAPSARNAVLSAFLVIFLAEWGDLTQILTAELAARYGSPFAVGVAALVGLLAVGALAVWGSRLLLRRVSVRRVRQLTAVVLLGLAAYSAVAAAG